MKYKRLTALLSASILLLSGCSGLPRERSQTYTDTLFDTVISVQIFDSVDEDVLKGCEKPLQEYDSMFSNKIEDSEISRINSAGGNPVEVSKETIKADYEGHLLQRDVGRRFRYHHRPGIQPLGLQGRDSFCPFPEAIAEAVSHVNYENIIIRIIRLRFSPTRRRALIWERSPKDILRTGSKITWKRKASGTP